MQSALGFWYTDYLQDGLCGVVWSRFVGQTAVKPAE